MRDFICFMGEGYDETVVADSAKEAAEDYAGWYHCPSDARTIHCVITVEDDEGEVADYTVSLHPLEPTCGRAKTHNWVDAGVLGKGVGVVFVESCDVCGCRRETDTADSLASTGERVTSIRYR